MSTLKNRFCLISTLAIMLMLSLAGCDKLIETPVPNNVLISTSIFTDSITAQSAVNGMYRKFYQNNGSSYFDSNIQLDPARLADETYAVASASDNFTTNTLTSADTYVETLWVNAYNVIYSANSIIEGATESKTLSGSFKKQIISEALFMRSLCYFYLVNYFGDVPLVLTTDVTVTGSLPREASAIVYERITADLITARDNLSATYSWSQGDRTRANTWAASALLARAYLYQGKWVGAETEATRVIDQTSLFHLVPDPNDAFLANSSESILSLYADYNGFPYQNLANYITGTSLPTYAIRTELLNAFEPGDARATKWIGTATFNGVVYKFPYKYKTITNVHTEFQICLRLSEQFLVRAEARAQQANIGGAVADLNTVRARARNTSTDLPDYPSTLPLGDCLNKIAHERQVELFVEWGDRWLNLKRTNTATTVLGAEKPTWKPTAVLYPIPQSARLSNPKLTQNPGYN